MKLVLIAKQQISAKNLAGIALARCIHNIKNSKYLVVRSKIIWASNI